MSARSRAVDAVFGGLELVASLYDFVRQMRRPREQPIPLTHRAVQHQQAQIRSASDGRKLTILPPRP